MIRPLAEFSAHLSDTASLIGAVPLAEDLVFTGVTHNDKDVEAGDLFLAIPGAKVHGAEFIKSARAQGAVAVITDAQGAQIDSSLPTLVVKDVRGAGALVAASLVFSSEVFLTLTHQFFRCLAQQQSCDFDVVFETAVRVYQHLELRLFLDANRLPTFS